MNDLFFDMVLKLIKHEKVKYVLDKNKFTKESKMLFEDFIFYILGNRGKTVVLELDDYFKIKYTNIFERENMSTTKQNFSSRRMDIDPLFFKDANELAIKKLYSSEQDVLKKFKGLILLIVDGSQVKLPNTRQTREEFNVGLRALKETKTPKARVSVMSDARNEFIIDSAISNISLGESVLAFEHIEKADKIMDLSNSIVVFDRNYASTELIVQLLMKKSYFIFRLKSDTFKKERDRMKSDDECIEINLNSDRTRNIKNKEIKAKAKELRSLELRVVDIPLENGEIETLLTNLPEELGTSDELKGLYGERWQVEKGYDVLKNKLHIENFSGKKRISIEQDFYSQILMYNILIEHKTNCNKELLEKSKNNEYEYEYKVNVNVLAGKLKSSLYEMFLAPTEEERRLIKEEVHKLAKKNIIKVKKEVSTPRNKNILVSKYPYNNRKNF